MLERASAMRRSGGSVGGGCLRGGSSARSAVDTCGHRDDGALERLDRRRRRLLHAADLADVLPGGGLDLLRRRLRVETAERRDVAAHAGEGRSARRYRRPVPAEHRLAMRARIARLLGAWVLISSGVPLLIDAQLGVAPFDALTTGLVEVTGASFGVIYIIVSLAFYVAGALLGTRPGIASVVGTFALAPVMDAWLDVLPTPDALVARSSMLAGGIVLLGIGICLVVSTDLGAGPTEVVMLGLVRHRWGIVPARLAGDGVPLVAGAILGGEVGVGTVVFLLAMPPIVRIGLRWLHYVPPVVPLVPAPDHAALGAVQT